MAKSSLHSVSCGNHSYANETDTHDIILRSIAHSQFAS